MGRYYLFIKDFIEKSIYVHTAGFFSEKCYGSNSNSNEYLKIKKVVTPISEK